jgi:hypothetical protein
MNVVPARLGQTLITAVVQEGQGGVIETEQMRGEIVFSSAFRHASQKRADASAKQR